MSKIFIRLRFIFSCFFSPNSLTNRHLVLPKSEPPRSPSPPIESQLESMSIYFYNLFFSFNFQEILRKLLEPLTEKVEQLSVLDNERHIRLQRVTINQI